MNSLLAKTYEAGGAINPCRIVKMGSADGKVIQATDGSAAVIGVVDHAGIDTSVSYADGDRVDVHKVGIALVKLGGTVTRGAWLTSDANGKAVAVSIVAGTPVYCIGQAEISGVDGDVIPVDIRPTVVANDTGIATAEVTVSTAEVLALNATPKTLVAAPGSGKAIIVEDAQFFYDYNSAAYAGIAAGEDLAIKYTDASGAQIAQVEATGFLDQTTDQFRHVRPTTTAQITPVANSPVVLHMLTGEIITGNSPVKVRVRYRTVDVSW